MNGSLFIKETRYYRCMFYSEAYVDMLKVEFFVIRNIEWSIREQAKVYCDAMIPEGLFQDS